MSEGGNPAPLLSWRVAGVATQPSLQQADVKDPSGLWTSVSRLTLPVSRSDNAATVECILEHPAVNDPVSTTINLEIFFPPRVTIASVPSALVEGGAVSVSCLAESNPPARIAWRRINPSGNSALVGNNPELVLNPVHREDAGTYQCTAENELGLSKPQTVPIIVNCKYSNYMKIVFSLIYIFFF